MNETLLDAYRTTRYLVCVDGVEWAELRIDQPLPASLQSVVGAQNWGFITAWNPLSVERDEALNLSAQRALYASLKRLTHAPVLPAIGIGANGWSEPSLFVVGTSPDELDVLARERRQNAYVHGHGASTANLRLLPV
jgi:hypothetical protein